MLLAWPKRLSHTCYNSIGQLMLLLQKVFASSMLLLSLKIVSNDFSQIYLFLIMLLSTKNVSCNIFNNYCCFFGTKCILPYLVSGNDIEQTANTHKLITWNNALIKNSKPDLSN
jgi:hypothetical protein